MTSVCSKALAVIAGFAIFGCGASLDPLDPSSADERLILPGTAWERYGSPTAYEHATRGEVLYERGDFAGAAEEFKMAVDADPTDNYLRVRLAMARLETGDLKKAKRNIERALKADSSDGRAWLALAEFRKRKGDDEGAEEAARRALRVEPMRAEAAVWLAGFYREKGEEKARAEILRRAVESNPLNAELRLGLAEACLAVGDRAEAVGHLAEFLRLRPMSSKAVAQLATAEIDSGYSSVGAEILALAVDADPSAVELKEQLVEVLADLGLIERAKPYLDALPLPDEDDVKGTVEKACLLVRLGEPYEARALLVSSLGTGSKAPTQVVAALAGVEKMLGRFEYADALTKNLVGSKEGKSDSDEAKTVRLGESRSCEFVVQPELTRSSY